MSHPNLIRHILESVKGPELGFLESWHVPLTDSSLSDIAWDACYGCSCPTSWWSQFCTKLAAVRDRHQSNELAGLHVLQSMDLETIVGPLLEQLWGFVDVHTQVLCPDVSYKHVVSLLRVLICFTNPTNDQAYDQALAPISALFSDSASTSSSYSSATCPSPINPSEPRKTVIPYVAYYHTNITIRYFVSCRLS